MAVIRKALPLIALVAWTAGLVYLIVDDNYVLFLKPKFHALVWISLVIALVFIVSLLPGTFSGTLPEQKHPWVKAMILVLPLVFIIGAGQSTLGTYALSKRPMASLPEKEPSALKTSPPVTESGEALTSISTLVREFDRFSGKSVRLEGLFSGTVVNHDELSAVFRYFITCCAADAQPVGVFMNRVADDTIQDNSWVRVEGKVAVQELDGFQIIFMDLEKITPAEQPGKNAAYIYD